MMRWSRSSLCSTPEREAIAGGAWPTWMPSALVNLGGLDLRGGAHLLAEVHVEDVYAARMDAIWSEVLAALREERATVGTIRRQDSPPDELRVSISEPEGMTRALEAVRALARPVVSLTGGVGSTDIEVAGEGNDIIVTLSEAERIATDDRTMQQTLEIIRRRVDEAGTREPTIQRQGADRILVQVPGLGSAQELKDLIGKTAKLEFHPVVSRTSDGTTQPGGPRQVFYPSEDEEGIFYVLEQSPVVTGEELSNAQPSFDQNGLPAVNFSFNVSGARKFCEYTGDNVGQPFAIVLDKEVISAPPRINEQICGGSGIITGNFSIESSTELAILLRAGALPAELTYVQERTVGGPELGGQDSIDAGKIASIIAFAGVLIFMALSYGWFGMIANVALILTSADLWPAQHDRRDADLAGHRGHRADHRYGGGRQCAGVRTYPRGAEIRQGPPARAIELGYEKALSAILDANITTFITAVILFVMGSGPVRGFSVTLGGLGILTSVFTAIFVTRLMIVMWFERRKPKNLEV